MTNVTPITPPNPARIEVTAAFSDLAGIPLRRVLQTGRDRHSARFALELTDGTTVPLGTIDVLWSKTETSKALLVTVGRPISEDIKAADWRALVGALIECATDVREVADESFTAQVADSLLDYADRASTAIEEQAREGGPFIRDNHLHVNVAAFTSWLKRECGEIAKQADVRQALLELGERIQVDYNRDDDGTRNGRRRTSRAYYAIPFHALGLGATEAA